MWPPRHVASRKRFNRKGRRGFAKDAKQAQAWPYGTVKLTVVLSVAPKLSSTVAVAW